MENIIKTEYNIECSPSHLFNNLSTNANKSVFIHNSESTPRVITIDNKLFQGDEPKQLTKLITKFVTPDKNEIYCAQIVTLGSRDFLLLSLIGGFQLWTSDGLRLIHEISSAPNNIFDIYYFYSSTIGSIYDRNDAIYCGNNKGQVFSIYGSGLSWNNYLAFENANKTVINLQFCSENKLLVSALEDGTNLVLTPTDFVLAKVTSFVSPANLPLCTSTYNENHNLYVCGYLNGQLEVYKADKEFSRIMSIDAHARGVNCLDSKGNWLVSGGDDCSLNIYELKEGKLKLKRDILMENKMVMGVQVTDAKEKLGFLCNFFDSTSIIKFENIY